MNTLAILSPGYPHQTGGVTHHTARLHTHWTADGNLVEVIGDTTPDPEPTIARLHRSGVRSILIQYVPFLYGRRGISTLPERFARAARARNMAVTIFVHEPWVPPTRLPWIPLSWIHRRQLRRLIRISDNVVTTVPSWRDALGGHVDIVYIGCTLGELDGPIGAGEPLRAPVVFSPFAGGMRWDWIVDAAGSIGTGPPLIVIGADAASMRDHAVVGRWFQSDWDYRGHLPAPDLLDLLSRAQLVLAPYVDGLTGRRTSAFAATATGARVLTSRGHLSDPFFFESPLHVAATLDDFVQRARSLWHAPDSDAERRERLAWHRKHLDAAALDKRLLDIVVQ